MSSTEETGTYLSHWRRMKRVLVATDGSLSAADAIGFAVDFASAREAELTFVHVVPTIEFVPTAGVDDVHGALCRTSPPSATTRSSATPRPSPPSRA